jgi:hypothetical protein
MLRNEVTPFISVEQFIIGTPSQSLYNAPKGIIPFSKTLE